MPGAPVEAKFKVVLNGINQVLKPLGFRRSASSWRRLTDVNCALIEAQRSRTNTADSIRFTFNVGTISRRLLAEESDLDISRAGSAYAHLRDRIGFFLPVRENRWWTVDEQSKAEALVDELRPLVETAVSFFGRHISDAQLIALWQSGRSPRLTANQRERNLRRLTTNLRT
jgi:hypothetical protein